MMMTAIQKTVAGGTVKHSGAAEGSEASDKPTRTVTIPAANKGNTGDSLNTEPKKTPVETFGDSGTRFKPEEEVETNKNMLRSPSEPESVDPFSATQYSRERIMHWIDIQQRKPNLIAYIIMVRNSNDLRSERSRYENSSVEDLQRFARKHVQSDDKVDLGAPNTIGDDG
jgi:hypothetical protein